jgi:hypothetical protein
MANKIKSQFPATDNIYTSQLIKKAIGKLCIICNQWISDEEANNKDFEYSQTKSKHEIFVHKHCLKGGKRHG